MTEFSVMSFNICRHYIWDEKSELLLKMLNEENPTILCLQEVVYDPEIHDVNENEGITIQKELDYDGTYSLNTHYFKTQHFLPKRNGVGTLFQNFKPKLSYSNILPEIVDGNIKNYSAFICTLFEISNKNVWVINTHFSYRKEGRFENWATVKDWIENNTKDSDNIIFCGDFNTNDKHGDDIHNDITEYGFRDSWSEVNTDSCVTYHSVDWWLENYPDSYESESIKRKNHDYEDSTLDYIFIKGDDINVLEANAIDLSGKVSDHFALHYKFAI